MPRRKANLQSSLSETHLTALMRQNRWNEQEACSIVHAWRQSGLSRRAFAEQFGVKPYRLEHWSGKVKRLEQDVVHTDAQTPVKMFPVRLARTGARKPKATDADCPNDCIELVVPSGVRVRLGQNFDIQTLRRIMEAVGC